uniref:DNA ligase (NAD(+)) n=1 Tax=viral metagenome TaxID=1070528 RepID=A0A6C0JQQ5_9ZZZZ
MSGKKPMKKQPLESQPTIKKTKDTQEKKPVAPPKDKKVVKTEPLETTKPAAAPKKVKKEPSQEKKTDTTQLVATLSKAADAYYNGKDLLMDDDTYDAAIKKLESIDPENPYLQKIGQDNNPEFQKRQHKMPMGSQQKAANAEEFKKWHTKGYANGDTMTVNHKLDGLSIELVYEKGKLVHGITRGKGNKGDDITKNVLKMKGIVKKLDYPATCSIRGEIIMKTSTFEKKYKPKGHKMVRTMAAGLSKRPDGVGCQDLHIIVYDILLHNMDDPEILKKAPTTEKIKMQFLESQGFTTAETRYCKNIKEVLAWYNELQDPENETNRDSLEIEIDGLVIKCNTVDHEDMKRMKPNRQIALKFPPRQVTSTLQKVVWNISGTNYTPVAHITPVNIDGSTVTKASLCNPGVMKDLGLRIGSTVTVVKRGDIIPKIESVIEIGDGDEIDIPTECSNCSEQLVCTDTKLYCPNEECGNKLSHQIKKWIEVHDIKEFGKELIKVVYENDLIKDLSGLYTLEITDLQDQTTAGGKRLGTKNAKKAVDNLRAVTEVSLSKFIAGFDIPTISEKTIEVLVEAGLDTLDKIRGSNIDRLTSIKGIGESKANALLTGLSKYKKEMNNMLKHVTIEAPIKKITTGGALTGMSVCFTGKLSMPRKEFEALVKTNGGTCKAGVTKGLTYLVTDDPDSGTSKNEKARALDVQVIDEETLLGLMGK